MSDFERRPLWYKDAVIYEVHVKSFLDSDGNGMGDFRGLISKLDYIRDLGVNAIWLLPFYPSPLKDDGYDIADYRGVNPAYGTLETFREFLQEAHARGIYVITEVVINHTSDQHPWFQRARRAAPGSPERDYYVWSASPEKYRQARVIFQDFEASNWTWDPVAQAYFWHRFYGHQPDLNFDCPEVHKAVFDVLDYWLEMGVDGLRLDAIPYLYEREGSSCENLPETHEFLRKLSAHVHGRYDHRMLLAEANQWPDDAAAYFANGEGCDMAFHFPLMTRLYMALEMEDRFPMVDILDQTPRIPENCQWAIFLRNHDELTLEMVTDEERDYMYRVFAKDRRARINVGIRRRLAPLLENSRRKIELLNTLLFSLPGTPVIYYGDEIGMGDNFLLGDRDGVRTPMQWSAEANAGFSQAPPEKLYLPVIANSENHFAAVNVALQEDNSASLLWWMRRRIRLRQAHPVFGRGTLRFLEPKNSRVLAFVRESDDEAILVLANLSRYPQTAQLELQDFRGAEPLELTGRSPFPAVSEGTYPVMLGAHDALWILLRKRTEDDLTREVRSLPDAGKWESLSHLAVLPNLKVSLLESHILQASWFEGQSFLLSRIELCSATVIEDTNTAAVLVLLRAHYVAGESEDYNLWLGFVSPGDAENLPARALVSRIELHGQAGYLCEAQHLAAFQFFLTEYLSKPESRKQTAEFLSVVQLAPVEIPAASAHPVTQLMDARPGEFSILVQGQLMLRWFYKLPEGTPADLEILQELKRQSSGAKTAICTARAEYRPFRNESKTLGYVQQFPYSERATRDLAREGLKHFVEAIAIAADTNAPPSPEYTVPATRGFQDLPSFLQEALGGSWPEFVSLLGKRLAELHRLLAGCAAPDFIPEPFSLLYQHSLYHSVRGRIRRAFLRLEQIEASLRETSRPLASEVIGKEAEILTRLQRLTAKPIAGLRTRIHGDLRLDRILFIGKDFVFTGFDGLPWLSFQERRSRFSPLEDVAAVIRDLAAYPDEDAAILSEAPAAVKDAHVWAETWVGLSGGLFLEGYFKEAGDASFLPSGEEDRMLLLGSFLMERAAFDIQNLPSSSAEMTSALRLFAHFVRGKKS